METLQTIIAQLYVLSRKDKPLGNTWPFGIYHPSGRRSYYPNLASIEAELITLGAFDRIQETKLDDFGRAIVVFYPPDVLPL